MPSAPEIFISANVGLGTAAKRAVGVGANQIPDMGFFQAIIATGNTLLKFPFIDQYGNARTIMVQLVTIQTTGGADTRPVIRTVVTVVKEGVFRPIAFLWSKGVWMSKAGYSTGDVGQSRGEKTRAAASVVFVSASTTIFRMSEAFIVVSLR
ncbi:TPA: hypothetical protein KE579_000019 [Citrobacter braakii]|nr:hypothetical protein [Citrobacter braakii]